MGNNKKFYIRSFIGSMLVGLFFASLSQSCGVAHAGINKLIFEPKIRTIDMNEKWVKPELKLRMKYLKASKRDTNFVTVPMPEIKKTNLDSLISLYGNIIIGNQQQGLQNDEQIIIYLQRIESENTRLRKIIPGLIRKSKVAEEVKNDAVSMQAIWKMGGWILGVGASILVLLIIQTFITVYAYNRRGRLQKQ